VEAACFANRVSRGLIIEAKTTFCGTRLSAFACRTHPR
jgi:hypothetical protein